ncbi:phosphocholine-specific phospholipase C [Parapedobacter tibetensis]|uniref:phosphocholine-specific phospholipase C n=1 Tax=Parapedobacter tibetensis TaxID=2972951 RepID=UPI00214DBD62|nr:phospholipase C, phosphocholine-specific [Parapedobacter tibetensis]
MESRRTFLKKAALLAGATATVQMIPESIQRALAIDAQAGSTYLDAEHIVFLMQENRSFDHCYGTLRGVRGFNDPRAIRLPNGLPVWVQTNNKGESYAPFHLDIEHTKSTWMGSLPHGWKDMVHARNNGKMDTWLEAKKAGNPDYQHMPLTMGYYTRKDLPFYYAFADAFTVCDQHFCSSLTGTSANRSYFWAGAIREEPHNPDSVAHVDNGQINYKDVGWKTYPERLQEAGVEWKVYQNELSLPVGFEGEEEDWLANFTDNNLEFYGQYKVRFHVAHRVYMERRLVELEGLLGRGEVVGDERNKLQEQLTRLRQDIRQYNAANFDKLAPFEQEIHRRAFVTNTGDADYHRLETLTYTDEGTEKTVEVPKGDVFYQFRKDVKEDKLPTVSWLVAPCRFSDHPGSPWYGAWYVSEALDILTKNPEVWKKTIFILTYDENDGYFDHVPPFVPPHSGREESGAVPQHIDTAEEYVTAEQEKIRTGNPQATLDSPIGLGFRVPMVVASPWTKGGWVNSEVFDHTSTIQFLEHFLARKVGKMVVETNISAWRRLVCGDLTSVFRPVEYMGKPTLQWVDRNTDVARIYSAKTKRLPGNYRLLQPDELDRMAQNIHDASLLPQQEPGTKPACALPYDVSLTFRVDHKLQRLSILFGLDGKLPKTKQIGMPFRVHCPVAYGDDVQIGRTWDFAVKQGEQLQYHWPLVDFENGRFQLEVHGPNGLYGMVTGDRDMPGFEATATGDITSGDIELSFMGSENYKLHIKDLVYGNPPEMLKIKGKGRQTGLTFPCRHGWYDVGITIEDVSAFDLRFAGHVETGSVSITDPLMGKTLNGAHT